MKHGLAIGFALATSLSAQAVTPAGYGNTQGNAPSGVLFTRSAAQRLQQIVTDLPRTPASFQQLALRQGKHDPLALARSVTAQLVIAKSSYAARSDVYANNLVTPTVVMAARAIALPSQQNPPTGGYPAPFGIVLPFDQPWAYAGTGDVCVQFDQTVLSAPGPYFVDAIEQAIATPFTTSSYGTGCVAGGASAPVTLTAAGGTSWLPTPQHELGFGVTGVPWPPWTPAGGVMLSPQAVDRPNAALCASQLIGDNPLVLLLQPSGVGGAVAPRTTIPYDANLIGGTLHAQAFAVDPAQQPKLPIALSNRISITVPALPPRPQDVCTIYGSPAFGSGVLAELSGLVMGFR